MSDDVSVDEDYVMGLLKAALSRTLTLAEVRHLEACIFDTQGESQINVADKAIDKKDAARDEIDRAVGSMIASGRGTLCPFIEFDDDPW
jgi:hypothetical protein